MLRPEPVGTLRRLPPMRRNGGRVERLLVRLSPTAGDRTLPTKRTPLGEIPGGGRSFPPSAGCVLWLDSSHPLADPLAEPRLRSRSERDGSRSPAYRTGGVYRLFPIFRQDGCRPKALPP